MPSRNLKERPARIAAGRAEQGRNRRDVTVLLKEALQKNLNLSDSLKGCRQQYAEQLEELKQTREKLEETDAALRRAAADGQKLIDENESLKGELHCANKLLESTLNERDAAHQELERRTAWSNTRLNELERENAALKETTPPDETPPEPAVIGGTGHRLVIHHGSFDVWLTEMGEGIVELGIMLNGKSLRAPLGHAEMGAIKVFANAYVLGREDTQRERPKPPKEPLTGFDLTDNEWEELDR